MAKKKYRGMFFYCIKGRIQKFNSGSNRKIDVRLDIRRLCIQLFLFILLIYLLLTSGFFYKMYTFIKPVCPTLTFVLFLIFTTLDQ